MRFYVIHARALTDDDSDNNNVHFVGVALYS